MIVEIRKAEKCPHCGRMEFPSEYVVTCNTCDKDVTELYNERTDRAYELSFYYEDDYDKTERMHFCDWKCFKKQLLKMSKNKYLMEHLAFINFPHITTTNIRDFVDIILKGD